jgi:Ca2+:H+ antiporter
MRILWLLVFLPVALVLDWLGFNPILVFLSSALAIVPLAALMGDATEALAEYLGPTLGSLLNASLGNAPEIIISLFALHKGLIAIVKSSLTGAIVGNLLFGLGLSMIFGGAKFRTQKFDPHVAGMNAALLTLASFGLIIPAMYRMAHVAGRDPSEEVSLEISVVLFAVYVSSLVFTLVAHKPLVGKAGVKAEKEEAGSKEEEEEKIGWGRGKALSILAAVAIALAIMSEVLTGALEPAADSLGVTRRFAGVFLLAMVGNAAELINAIRFARKDKMDLAIGITVGASTQVALLVAPILVFAGYFLGQKMDLLFSPYEMWAVVLTVYITRTQIYDGSSNWLEGVVLIGLYFMLGIGLFYLPE